MVGHSGSWSARCRSVHRRQLVRPGRTRGPTMPTPSRTRTCRWAMRELTSSADRQGSATSWSANTTTEGALAHSQGAVAPVVERVSRAPLMARDSQIASVSGPRPCTCTADVTPLPGCGSQRSIPASASSFRSPSSAASSMPAAIAEAASSGWLLVPSIWLSSPPRLRADTPRGGRMSTARSGSQPSCTSPLERMRMASARSSSGRSRLPLRAAGPVGETVVMASHCGSVRRATSWLEASCPQVSGGRPGCPAG